MKKFEVTYNDQQQATSKRGTQYTVGIQKREIINADTLKISEVGITFYKRGLHEDEVVAFFSKVKSFREIK